METDKKEATAKGTVVEGEGKGEISKEELWGMKEYGPQHKAYYLKGCPSAVFPWPEPETRYFHPHPPFPQAYKP